MSRIHDVVDVRVDDVQHFFFGLVVIAGQVVVAAGCQAACQGQGNDGGSGFGRPGVDGLHVGVCWWR